MDDKAAAALKEARIELEKLAGAEKEEKSKAQLRGIGTILLSALAAILHQWDRSSQRKGGN